MLHIAFQETVKIHSIGAHRCSHVRVRVRVRLTIFHTHNDASHSAVKMLRSFSLDPDRS